MLADDLFSKSLEAEVTKRPNLLDLTEADATRYAPQHKFGRRRKGFHKAPALERVLVLEAYKWIIIRGEFFVQTYLEGTTEVHDGFRVFAHGFYLKYVDLLGFAHLVFDSDGTMKTTDKLLWRLYMFVPACMPVPAYMCAPSTREITPSIYGRPYMDAHI